MGVTSDQVLILIANIVAWPVIHIGFAWAATRAPAEWFDPSAWLFRSWPMERSGWCYEKLLKVRRWKDALPDGATWFRGGFAKGALASTDQAYLDRYIVETCRGEAAHWAMFLAAGIFFLWNTVFVGFIMVLYATIANGPCILVQRYNRIRFRRALRRRMNRVVEVTDV